jgi:hypothetical protein
VILELPGQKYSLAVVAIALRWSLEIFGGVPG